jgi:oligopeptide transport system substrate-binding protein
MAFAGRASAISTRAYLYRHRRDATQALQLESAARIGRVIALFIVALGASGCSPDSQSSGPSSDPVKVLIRAIGPEPDSMDPQKALSTEGQDVLRDLCEGLTLLDHQGAAIPGSADQWTISTDRLTYRFHIRADARWSNGDLLKAQDFVAGFRRLMDPATASSYAEILGAILNAPAIFKGNLAPDKLGVSATDDANVEIVLSAPTPYLLGLLAHPSTCPYHASKDNSVAKGGAQAISNGPFVLTEWVHGSHLTANRNPYYWDNSKTHVDRVRYVPIEDENAELLRFRAGDLQITSTIPRSQLDRVQTMFPGEVHIVPALRTEFYAFNLRRAPFKDNPKLRRALSLVIDRERLVSAVLHGSGVPAYGWVSPGIQGYEAQSFDYRGTPMPARVAEAKRLYREAGYSPDMPLKFELRFNQSPILNQVAVVVASMWKESLGVEVTLTTVEFKALVSEIEHGDVEGFRSSWSADYDDAFTYIGYLASGSGINLPHYESAEYDGLTQKARTEPDDSARRQYLEQAERVALRDHALIPLYFQTARHLVSPKVLGWYDNSMNIVYSKDLSLRD